MMNREEKKSPGFETAWITARQARAAFDISADELARFVERGLVSKTHGHDRSLRYDAVELRVALERANGSRRTEGEIAAMVFDHFVQGRTPTEIVRISKQTPERVLELRRRFDELEGSLVLSPAVVREIANILGTAVIQEGEQLPRLFMARLAEASAHGRNAGAPAGSGEGTSDADTDADADEDFGEILDPATGKMRKLTAAG